MCVYEAVKGGKSNANFRHILDSVNGVANLHVVMLFSILDGIQLYTQFKDKLKLIHYILTPMPVGG